MLRAAAVLSLALLPLLPGDDTDRPERPDENDPRWHEDVRAIAEVYESWLRVDDMLRWAPELCSLPPAPVARFSAAREKTPHERKIYALSAKDAKSYQGRATAGEVWEMPDTPAARRVAPMTQVLVKQAWKPERMTAEPDDGWKEDSNWGRSRLHPVERDGHWYRGDEFAGLFVIFRPHAPAAPTDDGWVYATVTPEGEVTGAGRMASCMACHEKNEGRLFGLPAAAKETDGR